MPYVRGHQTENQIIKSPTTYAFPSGYGFIASGAEDASLMPLDRHWSSIFAIKCFKAIKADIMNGLIYKN